MRLILLSACLLFCAHVFAQDYNFKNDTAKAKTDFTSPTVYTYVEQMPVPDFDMQRYLSKTLKYPDEARENNIEGRVLIKFIVTQTGEIDSAYVLKGIGGGCDEVALNAIRNMPRWKPGTQDGKPVKVYFTQPITFNLEGRGRKKKHPKVPPQ